jgi:hypothetical protein
MDGSQDAAKTVLYQFAKKNVEKSPTWGYSVRHWAPPPRPQKLISAWLTTF